MVDPGIFSQKNCIVNRPIFSSKDELSQERTWKSNIVVVVAIEAERNTKFYV